MYFYYRRKRYDAYSYYTSGVGKTKLGHLLGEIYYKLGVINWHKKYKCPLEK